MIKISYLMRRQPHLSHEEFISYWTEKHPQSAPRDAFSVLGVKRYCQCLPLDSAAHDIVIGPRTGLDDSIDGIAELWIESREALGKGWTTEQAVKYIEIFFKDEQNFIDWKRSTIVVSKEDFVIP